MKKSTEVCRNHVWKLLEINRDKPFIDHVSGTTKTFLGHWTPCLQICSWDLLRNSCLVNSLGNLSLETCSWEPVLGHLSLETLRGNLAWEPPPAWEPLGIFANLLQVITCSWEACLETWLGNLLFGTLLRNLFLRTFGNPGNLFLGTLLGNLASERLPGNLGNLVQWDFGCSDLLRDLYYGWRPQVYAVGEKGMVFMWLFHFIIIEPLLAPEPEPIKSSKTICINES